MEPCRPVIVSDIDTDMTDSVEDVVSIDLLLSRVKSLYGV